MTIPFEQTRIAFGIPVGNDSVSWRFMASLMEMQKPPQHGLIIRQGSLIDKSRNEIVSLMLSHPAQFTHLCFLDSDMIFPGHVLQQLYASQKEVVGGLYFQRVPPYAPVVFKQNTEGQFQQMLSSDLTVNALQQVGGCGTGCLLIARSVFERMPKPWFRIESTESGYQGEDLYFSKMCQKQGVPVFLDTSLIIGHMSSAGVFRKDDAAEPTIKLLY